MAMAIKFWGRSTPRFNEEDSYVPDMLVPLTLR